LSSVEFQGAASLSFIMAGFISVSNQAEAIWVGFPVIALIYFERMAGRS
jgi:hypothetical protein